MKEAKLQQKQQVVSEVADKMKRAQSIILLDYRGLTVDEVTNLRNQFRAAEVEYKVIKNNVLLRAANELGIEGAEDYFKGPTAVAFGYNDPVAPAKILAKFVKDTKKTEIKGGVLDGKVIDAAGIDNLAKLPSKEELIAKMMGSMNAPITNFVGVLAAVPGSFVRALNAIREQKEAQGS
ncbi:50S ribosomal protein L10 [Christensenellaceae bacterium OttesenSCG-928-K19]|nr:50S ribosomal protein L10 [Christensenellaceae bacterium OttesenSCG-928-K19]